MDALDRRQFLKMVGAPAVGAALPAGLDEALAIPAHSRTGSIDLTGSFFQSLGTNGRTCETCHLAGDGWTVSQDGNMVGNVTCRILVPPGWTSKARVPANSNARSEGTPAGLVASKLSTPPAMKGRSGSYFGYAL